MSKESCLDSVENVRDRLDDEEYAALRKNCLSSEKGKLSDIVSNFDDPVILAAGGLAAGGAVVGAVVIGAAAVGVGFLALSATNKSKVVQTNYTRDSSGNLLSQSTIIG